ncbi:MAG: hypothetical protein DRG09_04840 [Epsilonproteobacteria bacterium]|nr:MAG: hypothetical protein DRG09_04840 [Campylobacterota bacterium]
MKNILLLALVSTLGFSAQQKQTTYMCAFNAYATAKGSFDKGTMKFTIIMHDNDGTFTIKRSSGSTQGKIIKGDKGVSFVEISERGNITTTSMTILPPREKEQKAVHSQNILVGGKIMASQHYGSCQFVNPAQTKKRHITISKIRRHEIYQKLNIEAALRTLPKEDTRYVYDALSGVFPSRQEMEADLSIEGMIIVSQIMDEMMKVK